MIETEGINFRLSADTSELEAGMEEVGAIAQSVGDTIGSSLTSALEQAVIGGKDLSDVLRNAALQISNSALSAALSPVQDAVSSGFGNIFSNLFGAANGAVVGGGHVRPFARGGIVSGPTTFPLRSGTGLVGEAGPEAIMPLSRGSDGKLGVKAQSGGAPVSVVVNISTPNVQSFQRSESQIAGVMSRALSRAHRTQ